MTSPKPKNGTSDTKNNSSDTLSVTGAGSFGIIHAGSPSIIYKRTFQTYTTLWSLLEEYEHHVAIDAAFDGWNRHHAASPIHIRIPHPIRYLDPSNYYAQAWWATNLHSFGPSGSIPPPHAPQPLLQASRIPAVPKKLSRRLIDIYCPSTTQTEARASAANEDCLMRLYLGKEIKNEDGDSGPRKFFSLRNFKHDRERMCRLGVDSAWVAREMGRALTVINWLARSDGGDIEFVLGGADIPSNKVNGEHAPSDQTPIPEVKIPASSAPSTNSSPLQSPASLSTPILPVTPSSAQLDLNAARSTPQQQQQQPPPKSQNPNGLSPRIYSKAGITTLFGDHAVAIYALDFNQCRPITFSEDGVAKCVQAFFLNDPYYPKPPPSPSPSLPVAADGFVNGGAAEGERERERTEIARLWESFEAAYLRTAAQVAVDVGGEEGTAVRACAERWVVRIKERRREILREGERERERARAGMGM